MKILSEKRYQAGIHNLLMLLAHQLIATRRQNRQVSYPASMNRGGKLSLIRLNWRILWKIID